MRQLVALPRTISEPLREDEILVIRGGSGPDPDIPPQDKQTGCGDKAAKCDKCDKCDKCGFICF